MLNRFQSLFILPRTGLKPAADTFNTHLNPKFYMDLRPPLYRMG